MEQNNIKCFKISGFIDSKDNQMTVEKLSNKFMEWIHQNNLSFCGTTGEFEDENGEILKDENWFFRK